jgi:hypothetical protein
MKGVLNHGDAAALVSEQLAEAAKSSLPQTYSDCKAVLEEEQKMGSDLNRFFSRMGARVKVLDGVSLESRRGTRGSREEAPRIALDLGRDKHGEYFEIRTAVGSNQDILVLDVQPRERHLLLLSRQFGTQGQFLAKQKFLCGHDERHWFVSGNS